MYHPIAGVTSIRILFIYSLDDVPSWQTPVRSHEFIQFGISYIAAILDAHGHKTDVLVLGSNTAWQRNQLLIDNAVRTFDPFLICFTSVASQYAFIRNVARHVRDRWSDKFLLIGGPHPSLNPESVICDTFDAVCIGEGEFPTLELADKLAAGSRPENIQNLWLRQSDGTVERNSTRAFHMDLDSLPFPNRRMWRRWIRVSGEQRLAVLAGRGCPFQCTYCSNHALQKLASGRYVRMRSPSGITAELEELRKEYPEFSDIYFEAESIALDVKWLREFCRSLEDFNATNKKKLSFGANFRVCPQSVDEEVFLAMSSAGFQFINIGLESGSERVRRDTLNRHYSNDEFLKAVAMARKYKLKVNIFNMIGVPGETLEDHMETVRLNRLCQPEKHLTSIFFPYPGTAIYDKCRQQGLLSQSVDCTLERRRAVLDLPGFSRRDIQNAYLWFDYRIYRGYRSRLGLLFKVFSAVIWNNAYLACFARLAAATLRRIKIFSRRKTSNA